MSFVLPTSSTHAPAPSGSHQSLSTSLSDWPMDATFQIMRKPVVGITPVDDGKIHIGDLIPSDGVFLLVCIEDVANRTTLKRELSHGHDLGVPVIMVGGGAMDFIASALYSNGHLMSLHGLTRESRRATLFAPSATLCRLLRISPTEKNSRTRNALVLIQDGHVRTSWISGGEGLEPHNWTSIESAIRRDAE